MNDENGLWIGVTAKHGSQAWVEKNTRNYLAVLAEMGARPVVLAPDAPVAFPDGTVFVPEPSGRLPETVLDRLAGLVLAGGGDVHPRFFGATLAGANPATMDAGRDELELTLARRAMEQDLPLFGICRGCQVLNVAAGGGMVQDFPGHRSSKEHPVLHQVDLAPGSRVQGILGVDSLPVNTYHHQGVDQATLAPGLRAGGRAAPDAWLLEAFESPGHRWVVGVQWHPERLFELPAAHRLLWESFLAACKERA